MRRKIIYLLGYLIYWLVFFIFFKVVFLIYHYKLVKELSATTISGIFFHGIRLDLAFSAYLSAIPFLLITIASVVSAGKWLNRSILIYHTFVVFFMTFLCTADLELFRVWGFRLDSTPLMYINTPTEMVISVGSSPILFLIIINILVNLFFSYAYRFLLHPIVQSLPRRNLLMAPAYLTATLSLIIFMRGGFQLAPINHSSVYFSQNLFANQAAINVPWNFFHAISKSGTEKKNHYTVVKQEEAEIILNEFYPQEKGEVKKVLTATRPNIVLIIWESLTAKIVEDLGGMKGITPSFNQLAKEGILFTRMYSSGDRSDKGLVAILNGYPSQPATSIVKIPSKTKTLPHLAQSLNGAGYNSSFYYGGELDFANLKWYLQAGGFGKLVGIEDFDEEQLNSKWGAHDHVVLEKVMHDIENRNEDAPFFKTIFTLSSHEPFEIPVQPKFPGNDINNRFLSSHHYTDSAIGKFVAEAKKKEWYDNTLFVIIADHGNVYPGLSLLYEKEKFHIPMLWFGGALNAMPQTVTATSSQTDFAATLLSQLNIPHQHFSWSKDILASDSRPFAMYFFKDGVGLVTDSSYFSFDNVGQKLIEQNGEVDSTMVKSARAYLQMSYGDYLNK